MSSVKKPKNIIFVLFGATGDLAGKKIFPALEKLFAQKVFSDKSKIIAVSRRDWDVEQFISHIDTGDISVDFKRLVSYSKVDIETGLGYGELHQKLKELKKEIPKAELIVHLCLAPKHQSIALSALFKEKIMIRGRDKLMIEKPFGTDEKTAKVLDKLLLSKISEEQIYRVDHYLAKDTVRAIMDLHESTKSFSLMISAAAVSLIRIRLWEKKGIEDRGRSYDHVGAFKDVGQNHILEMLAVLAADVPKKTWQKARTDVLKHLVPPVKTCALSHRGQYEGYELEFGVKPDSETETAFEVVTSLSAGKLEGVPLVLEAGKRMPVSEVFIDILFKKLPDLPRRIRFSVQPEREIVIEHGKNKIGRFGIPGANDAYANIIRGAIDGETREFVGSGEIEALWRYADHVVDCWHKVPLQIYSENKPFLVK